MKNNSRTKIIPLVLVLVLLMGVSTGFSQGTSVTFKTPDNLETSEADPEVGVIDDDLMEFLAAYIKTNYYVEISNEDLQEAVSKGIFESLDRHSKYFTEKEFAEFMIDTGGEFGGIGIYIQERDDFVEVISPIEDTPGERAGLEPLDLIVEIDGIKVEEITFEKALDMMRGEPNTVVTLGVRRAGVPDMITMEITREIIKVNPVKYSIREDGVGYLRITQFNAQTAEKVKVALEEFKAKNIKDLVIDVRGNPGGYLDQVIKIADYLVPEGMAIIHEQYNDKKTTTYAEIYPYDFDIAILIDGGSASASEILAGAIKDNKLGVLVGTKTFGKGTVQTTRQLNSGAGLKLTIAEYLTAGDIHIDGKGIEPDVMVEGITQDSLRLAQQFVPMIETKISRVGTRGLDVYGMQQRLKFLGYEIDVDGKFGNGTRGVLVNFQRDNKIPTTGVLDYKTETKLVDIVEATMKGDIDAQLDKAVELLTK